MRPFSPILLSSLALVMGCHRSVFVEETAARGGQSSSIASGGGAGGAPISLTTGDFGGAPAMPETASSDGVGGAPASVIAAAGSGNGGSPTLQSSTASGGGDSTPSVATSASSGGAGGAPVDKSSAVASGSDGASGVGGASGTGGASGAGGASGSSGAGGSGGSPVKACSLCSDVVTSFAPPDALCPASQTKYLAVVQCACVDTCASVCGVAGSTDCLGTMAGNTPPDCAACLTSASGCLTAWDSCVGDDGVNTTLGGGDLPP